MLANSALLKGELEEEGSRGPRGPIPTTPLSLRLRPGRPGSPAHLAPTKRTLATLAKVGAAIVRRTPASAGTVSSVGQAALESGLVRQTKQAPTLAFVGFRGHCGGSTGRSKDQVSA